MPIALLWVKKHHLKVYKSEKERKKRGESQCLKACFMIFPFLVQWFSFPIENVFRKSLSALFLHSVRAKTYCLQFHCWFLYYLLLLYVCAWVLLWRSEDNSMEVVSIYLYVCSRATTHYQVSAAIAFPE